MGKIPNELREAIANNIKIERMKKFQGRGSGKRCAESFGVSPQQWSPWERGMRTPDEARLEQITQFFDVSVEYLRRTKNLQDLSYSEFYAGIRNPRSSAESVQEQSADTNPYADVFGEMPSPTFSARTEMSVPGETSSPPPVFGMKEARRLAVERFCQSLYQMILLGIKIEVGVAWPDIDKKYEAMGAGGAPADR
ncbi:MAG: helix-turn-helix domain-containing protein [Planctomycetaceae bacterium]|nr:helix-turn-helix domain-containing protein [Planctomycetaceae bacterium]